MVEKWKMKYYTQIIYLNQKKISQQGEHSEIYDNVKKVFIEEEYADGGMIQDFEIFDEQTGKSLFIKARSLEEAEGISETIDFDDYENGDIVDVLDDIDSYQEYADGGMIWASPNLRKKYEDAFGKIQDMLPEYAIESSKKELLIESYYWNYLLDVLEIEELDEKVANDWKVAREVEDGKLVQKGPYATRYMYSPSLDRLREQNEGEWYQYGSVSDTFAKGGIVTKSKVISELQKLGFGKEKAENLLEKHIDIYEINEDDEDAKTIALQIEEQYNQEYAKGGSILDLKDVYNELRSRIGRLEINEETSNYIYCDIRDWGNWEHDYEDYDRDEEDFEDDDAMILSRESSMRMSNIVKEVRAKYPSASISWNTSEKNYIDFQISRKMAKGGKVKERVYIDYLNKAKGFQKDRKYFDSYEDAVKWARSHFDKFDTDYIKYEYAQGGQISDWAKFVKDNRGYFQIDDEDENMIHLNTREHGNVGDETYGQEDVDYARYIIKKVREKYPKTKARLYDIDEWIDLELTYVPDETEVPQKSFEDYKKELYKNISKEWKGKKLNGWQYLGMDLAGVINWEKGDYTIKATPFWDNEDTIGIDVIKYEDSILFTDEIPFKLTYDVQKDTDRYIKLIEFVFLNTTLGKYDKND
jgi:hypothetical protein